MTVSQGKTRNCASVVVVAGSAATRRYLKSLVGTLIPDPRRRSCTYADRETMPSIVPKTRDFR